MEPSPWPPPQRGTHESALEESGLIATSQLGPRIAGLPGTACDETFQAAVRWDIGMER